MDIYDELGVRKVINGHATVTKLGGSIMPSEVVEAMANASKHFVDIDELQDRAGEKIAELTKNEAAYISCGAAAGLVLTTAACITGLDAEKRERLPHTDGMKNEVVIHKLNRNSYDFAIRQVGVEIVEIGTEEGTSPEDMERAINDKTAAIFYFYNINRMQGLVPLEQAIDISKRRGVPLIVDAAAQLPPVENLWRFTHQGADLAIFSGGKGLRGPQGTGLILGRKDLIEACAFHANPRAYIGRPMKVGKEEAAGLLAAVKRYVNLDHEKQMKIYEDQVRYVINEFSSLPDTSARRNFPSEAGQPMPRAEIIFDEQKLGMTRDDILNRLRDGEPSIALAASGTSGIYVNPQTLELGQERIITARIKQIIGCENLTR